MKPLALQPTPEQKAVIECDGSAFITACPGAGKTWVITERARLLLASVRPGRGIAFLSFTRAAISELETRLSNENILPSPVFPSFLGTFDSFVWHFLVAPFGLDGCDHRPRLIDDLRNLIIKTYDKAHPLPLSCFDRKTSRLNAERAKDYQFDVAQKERWQIQAYESAAANTRKKLSDQGLLDFDDARNLALERIKDKKFRCRLLTALAARFNEIIVDETQDCNLDDLEIISWLRESGLSVKLVCDPNQSIYEFRGGVSSQLLEYAETFEDHQRMSLTGNFRSAPNICRATAQFRPLDSRCSVDVSVGPNMRDTTPVVILSYPGRSVRPTIGIEFASRLKVMGLEPVSAPIVAATNVSAAHAAGQPPPSRSEHRTVRLAEAVTGFHFAQGSTDVLSALDKAHQIVLELEGALNGISYRQYVLEKDIKPADWRPQVLTLLRQLRFGSPELTDAEKWHSRAKEVLSNNLQLSGNRTISQLLPRNNKIPDTLAVAKTDMPSPRTIHSVKGMEFPAVCLVTTTTLGKVLDFLEKGVVSGNVEEEARKLYVASSRAERLLVIAAPKNFAKRLETHLKGQNTDVEVVDI